MNLCLPFVFLAICAQFSCDSKSKADEADIIDDGDLNEVYEAVSVLNKSQTFSENVVVTLSHDNEDVGIYFTLDGSVPSKATGIPYLEPIVIDQTSELRTAAVFSDGIEVVDSQNYIKVSNDLVDYQSTVPIVIIDNFSAGDVPDKEWTTMTQTGAGLQQQARQFSVMQIYQNEGSSSQISGEAKEELRLGIRVRGAFSSTWDPQPFSFEVKSEASDEDATMSLLGMPEDSDWILYHPFPQFDKTMLFNTFIWELAAQTGRFAPEYKFVEVFLNKDGGAVGMEDRLGVYALLEKVKRSPERIAIDELSADGQSGGFLLAINRMDAIPVGGFPAENGAMSPQFFHTPGPDGVLETPPNEPSVGDDIPRQVNGFINFESPNGYKITPTQRGAIEKWFADFEAVLYDDSKWLDPVEGYRAQLNVRDFIDYFLLLNLAQQGDGLLISMFPWVSNPPRVLHMGALWDFNNNAYRDNFDGNLLLRPDRLWYGRLFEDPTFEMEFLARWFELREDILSDQNMDKIVDDQAATIGQDLATRQGLDPVEWMTRLDAMKNNLKARANWLDGEFLNPLP